MNQIFENLQVDAAIVSNSTSSAIFSQSFSMAGYHRAAAVIQTGFGVIGNPISTVGSTGALITMELFGGDATTEPSAMSSITDAVVNIGTSSTSGLIQGAHAIAIGIHSSAAATLASAVSLQIDDIVFTSNSSASAATAHHFLTGLASVVAKSLTTVLKVAFPNMNTTYSTSGTDTCVVHIERTNITPDTSGIYAAIAAQTTITGLTIYPTKIQGILSFTPDKLTATASSFTNFSIKVNCTDSSAFPISVMVFREPVFAPNNLGSTHLKL